MYSCLKLKNNSILTSFKDQLPCAFVSSAKQIFHLQKTPTLILQEVLLKKLLWILYFATEQSISQCTVKGRKTHWGMLWSRSFSYFHWVWTVRRFNTSSKQKPSNQRLSKTRTPYWRPYSCCSLFLPLPWAYKFTCSVFWIGAKS